MKLFFLALFFFIIKKNTPLLAQKRAKNYTTCTTNQFVSISVILSSLPLCPFYVFFQSNEVVWWVLYIFPIPKSYLILAPIPREWPLVWLKNKKSYTSKAKTYINYYKYNKLLLIWQKCMITYLIIFIYAFIVCCLTDL